MALHPQACANSQDAYLGLSFYHPRWPNSYQAPCVMLTKEQCIAILPILGKSKIKELRQLADEIHKLLISYTAFEETYTENFHKNFQKNKKAG